MNSTKLTRIAMLMVLIVFVSMAQPSTDERSYRNSYVEFQLTCLDTSLNLPHQFIITGTDSVWVQSITLQRGKDYLIDERFGVIKIRSSNLLDSIFSVNETLSVFVRYQIFPLKFKGKYSLNEVILRQDTSLLSPLKHTQPVKKISIDDLFGKNLQRSGSIMRGFSLGNNRDFSLQSGFRMQMAGNVSEDVQIIAALTDEHSPIQPEGTTQMLQEVDKVFVEIRGPNLGATLGDYNINFDGSEFARFQRKVQGAQGVAEYSLAGTQNRMILGGAITRGKFNTNYFQGMAGVQGPYRLSGQNNERPIIVIAGTERVYLNGEPMVRGEVNDYIIDYANGEITFSSQRLIDNTSRITVDFEYTERSYPRNLVTAKTESKFFDEKILLNFTIFRESDDKNNPIDVFISDKDKEILQMAGDNKKATSRSGVDSVGQGKGQYRMRDTLIVDHFNGDSIKVIYEYAPEDTQNALYSVRFSYVGEGKGEYKKIAVGNFKFVGLRQGSFSPVIFLPVPKSQTLSDVDLSIRISDNLTLRGEYALSNYDANLFSGLDEKDNTGSAIKFDLNYFKKELIVGKTNYGMLNLNLRERYIGEDFVQLDRINEIEFDRKWNIYNLHKGYERIREAKLNYVPAKSLSIGGNLGWMKRGNLFSSKLYKSSVQFNEEHLPKMDYNLEIILSNEGVENTLDEIKTKWIRHRGISEYSLGNIKPGLEIAQESRFTRLGDSLGQSSFLFFDVTPCVKIQLLKHLNFGTKIGIRNEDSLVSGKLQRAWNAVTQQYTLQIQDWSSLNSTFHVAARNQNFTDLFKKKKNQNIQTILVRSQTRYLPFNRGVESDFYYEVTNEQSAKLERVFQRVPRGTGSYRYVGDLNRNNIVDEDDFEPTRFDGEYIPVVISSEELFPVLDLKASSRIRINGERLFPTGISAKLFSFISTETYLRVEEKSREEDKKKIYLMDLGKFLDEQTTLAGSKLISQDIYLFENNQDLSIRLRFTQRKGLTQYALQRENTYHRERSLRFRWQLVKEISNQNDIIFKNDNLRSNVPTTRVRQVFSRTIYTDWSYRPVQNIGVGFKIGIGDANNFDTIRVDINEQTLHFTYSIWGAGQARAELSREEVLANKTGLFSPFEITGGKIFGKSWLWSLKIDYRIGSFIQTTLQYNGRKEYKSGVIQNGSIEVRALF